MRQDPELDFFSGFQIVDRSKWIIVAEGIYCQSIVRLIDLCKELQAQEKEVDSCKDLYLIQ